MVPQDDKKHTEEHIFVLKYSEKDYKIKIQLIEYNKNPSIILIAQEKGIIINYNYQTEINEDDLKKQDNEIIRIFNTVPKFNKMILNSFNEDKISIKDIKENNSLNLMIIEKILGEEFTLEISLKKYDCNKLEIIEMLHSKINELEEDNANLKSKINEIEKEKYNLKAKVNSTESLNVSENGTYIPTSPNIGFSSINVQVKEKYYLSKFKRFISDDNSDTQYIPKSQWTFYENETTLDIYKNSRYGVISYTNDYKIKIIVYDSNGPASDNYGWCYGASIPKNSFVCNLYMKPVGTRKYDTVLFYEDEEIAVGHIEYEIYSLNQGCTCCWSSRSLLNNCILINDLNVE